MKIEEQIKKLRMEIDEKEAAAKAKVVAPTFESLFADTPDGDFRWKGEPEDVGNVWWCGESDCETGVHQDCQYIDMGRKGNKTWFVVYGSSFVGDGDYEPVGGWDEREGDEITDTVLSDLRFHLDFRMIEHFANWARYNLECALTGEDALGNWFDANRNTPENNIKAAIENIKYI